MTVSVDHLPVKSLDGSLVRELKARRHIRLCHKMQKLLRVLIGQMLGLKVLNAAMSILRTLLNYFQASRYVRWKDQRSIRRDLRMSKMFSKAKHRT